MTSWRHYQGMEINWWRWKRVNKSTLNSHKWVTSRQRLSTDWICLHVSCFSKSLLITTKLKVNLLISELICFPALSCNKTSRKVLLIVDPVDFRFDTKRLKTDNSRSFIAALFNYRPSQELWCPLTAYICISYRSPMIEIFPVPHKNVVTTQPPKIWSLGLFFDNIRVNS